MRLFTAGAAELALAWMHAAATERLEGEGGDACIGPSSGGFGRYPGSGGRCQTVSGRPGWCTGVAGRLSRRPPHGPHATTARSEHRFCDIHRSIGSDAVVAYRRGSNATDRAAARSGVSDHWECRHNASGLEGADRCLAMAKEAADFLLWAQDQAGAELFPFPAARGTSKARAMQVGTRFLERAEKSNQLEKVVRNGWAVEDLGDGGLQFDNGECGVAILQLYSVTGESRYLESARRAARWAMSRPLCPNWNYNAFSVDLLASLALATGESEYCDAALHKARLGVIPGQLTEGKRAGRWLDPHNARPPYHYIMMRSLARLAAALPNNHSNRGEIVAALRLGLETRNKEIIERGVMNKDDAVEALLLVTEVFKNDPEFLLKTRSAEALDTLLRLVSEEFRHGKLPLSPGPWGLALERMALAPMASTAGPEE
jgi:hypothetical protein